MKTAYLFREDLAAQFNIRWSRLQEDAVREFSNRNKEDQVRISVLLDNMAKAPSRKTDFKVGG